MRISVSLRSGFAPGDPRRSARWMIERAGAARAAGLDALFVGDHHVIAGGRYFQNSPVLGRLLAEWGPAPFGALYLLPLWHPVLVAEQVGTLAALGEGRFILQCAIGGDEQQFAGMGVSLRERPSRFEAALDVIRRLLAGERVTTDGPWPLRDAEIGLVPGEPVEVWIGGHAAPALDRAARLGDGWLAGPGLLPSEAGELVVRYRERCEAHGRTPSAVGIRRDIHLASSPQEAQRVAGPVLDRGYRGFDPAATIVGDAHQAADAFAALGEAGYTDVVVRHLADDQAAVLASFEVLAEARRLLA